MDKKDDPEEKDRVQLEWRDYVAFVIAAFETILIPLVVFVILLLVMLVIIR